MGESNSLLEGIISPHSGLKIGASILSPAMSVSGGLRGIASLSTHTPADEEPTEQSPSLTDMLRNKKRRLPEEAMISPSSLEEVTLYRVIPGERYPLNPYVVRLIEEVVNQDDTSVLLRPAHPYILVANEPEKERKMREHLCRRYCDAHPDMSLADFTRKLLSLWGGELELRTELVPPNKLSAELGLWSLATSPQQQGRLSLSTSSPSSKWTSHLSPLTRRKQPRLMSGSKSASRHGLSTDFPDTTLSTPKLPMTPGMAMLRFDDLKEGDLMKGLDFLDEPDELFGDTLKSAVKEKTWRRPNNPRRVTYNGKETPPLPPPVMEASAPPSYPGSYPMPTPAAAISSSSSSRSTSSRRIKISLPSSNSENQRHSVNKKYGKQHSSSAKDGQKRGVRWDTQERKLFLQGLEKFGAGNWKDIHRLIPDRTYVQVKSMGVYLVSKFNMSRGQGPSKVVSDYLLARQKNDK